MPGLSPGRGESDDHAHVKRACECGFGHVLSPKYERLRRTVSTISQLGDLRHRDAIFRGLH